MKIFKLFFAFSLLLSGVFIFNDPSSANGPVQPGKLGSCDSGILSSDDLDASCRCLRYQCRLSAIDDATYGGNDGKNTGTGRTDNAFRNSQYICVNGTTSQTDSSTVGKGNIPNEDTFKGVANLEAQSTNGVFKGTNGKCYNSRNPRAVPVPCPENLTDPNSIYQHFYVDEFSRQPNNQNIPVGAYCKLIRRIDIASGKDTSQAYWYYPGYFDPTKSTGVAILGACRPAFASVDLFGNAAPGVRTFFGCLPASLNGITAFVVRLLVGMSGMVTFIIILVNLLKILGNNTNAEVVADGRKKLTSAVITFIVLVSSLTILNIFGLQILDLGSLGGGLLRVLTGG